VYVRAWIDWDQNLLFDEDPIDLGSGSGNSTSFMIQSVLVPSNAPLGEVRIRLIVQTSGYASSPCDDSSPATHGEVEDWYINVTEAPSDTTPPTVITQNLDLYLDASGQASLTAAQVNNGSSDNTQIASLALDQTSFSCNELGQNTVTLTVEDTAGNSAQKTAIITVMDTIKPTVDLANLPAISAECSAVIGVSFGGGSTSIPVPTATDNCGGSLTATTTDSWTYHTQGNYTITWTYDDGNGNVATQQQQVVILDETAPVPDLSVLPSLTASCELTISNPPTATDNCEGTLTATTTDPLTYSEQGTYVIDWVYEDAQGNLASQVQQVIIEDQHAPVPDQATLPTLTATCALGVTTLPTATDQCEGVLTATTDDLLEYKEQGIYEITWEYEDARGNRSTQVQTVVILDEEAPVADEETLPGLFDPCSVVITTFPTATDNCAGALTATTEDALVYDEQGTYEITWIYEDGHGNSSTQIQEVVVHDTEAPVPNVATLQALQGNCQVSVGTDAFPKATDNCAQVIVGETDDPLTYDEQGEYLITWTFEDQHGNIATQEQWVLVQDQAAPVPAVANLPTLTAECALTVGEVPTASDACDGPMLATTTDPLTYDAQGSYQITWTYLDAAGNRATQTQAVIIEDQSVPTFILPEDVVTCEAAVGDIALQQVADNCGEPTVRYVLSGATVAQGQGDASQETFNVGETTVEYSVTDVNGNISSSVLTVTREALAASVTEAQAELVANEADQYQWIDCRSGQAIAGATNRSFAPVQSGDYAVVIGSLTCSDTSACVAFATVGLTPIASIAGLRLYPNPTHGALTLELTDTQVAASVILTDATGREWLRREDIRQAQSTLDVSELSAGIYFARVRQGLQQQVIRVVRQ
jgi:hypothetical protein